MARRLGFTTVTVLKAVRDGHRYGADIMDATGHGGGTVYKILRRLEERGLVRGEWEDAEVAEAERRPRRRYYGITREGTERLRAALDRFEALTAEDGDRADLAPGEA